MVRTESTWRLCRLFMPRDGGFGVFGVKQPGNQSGVGGPEGGDNSGGPARTNAGNGSGGGLNTGGGPGGPDGRPPGGPPAGTTAPSRSGRPNAKVLLIGIAIVAVVAAGAAYAVTQSGHGKSSPRTASGPVPIGHIRLTSVTPASRTRNVDGAYPIVINFSAPVAANSPKPRLSPQVPGYWSAEGNSLVFTPDTPFGPSTRVTVDIPAGIRSATGALLSAPATQHFTTSGYSQLALSEMLTDQGYLPMTFAPAYSGAARVSAAMAQSAPASLTAAGVAYDPPLGTFTFDSGYPSMLRRMWNPNQPNVLLRGAVMAFESEHNMTVDGSLTRQFWRALVLAQQSGEQNQNGYTYAVANKGSPETLTIYHNGHFAMRSLANTGIPSAPTVDGTFPVYAKYRFTIMSGTNPDGSHYSDPVQWVSYFNGGDAVHYFARPGYGYQQSLGCVELPYNDAVRAYPYLTYGSLVTVDG
jgi:hypothetical protein